MRILLIEDEVRAADRLRALIGEADGSAEVVQAHELGPGLELARTGAFDVILLDISLPGSDVLTTVLEAAAAAPTVPIVVLSELADIDLAMAAMRHGAEDYLIKDHWDAETVFRALRYSTERRRIRSQVQQAKREMQALTLNDEMTGLLNWRGFVILSEQELKRADRDRCAVAVVVMGVEGVDGRGGSEFDPDGQATIRDAGRTIGSTFRACDVKARIGGGEFAVLAWSPVGIDLDGMLGRLHLAVEKRNLFTELRVELKVGCALRLPGSKEALDELVARAGALQQSGSAADRASGTWLHGIEGHRQ